MQLYRRSKRRKSCKCGFSSSRRGGKPEIAALPPFETAEKLQLQDYRRFKRRKSCECRFTTPRAGVGPQFDPASFRRHLSFLFFVMGTWRTKPFEFSFSTPCTHHLGGTQLLAHSNGIHTQDAVESGRSRILLRLSGIISVRLNPGTVGEIVGHSI